MVRNSRVAIALGVEPNLVASGRLPVEFKPEFPQSTYDFAVAESGKPTHSSGHHNREVVVFSSQREGGGTFTFPPRFDKPASYVARDFQSLGHRTPLRN